MIYFLVWEVLNGCCSIHIWVSANQTELSPSSNHQFLPWMLAQWRIKNGIDEKCRMRIHWSYLTHIVLSLLVFAEIWVGTFSKRLLHFSSLFDTKFDFFRVCQMQFDNPNVFLKMAGFLKRKRKWLSMPWTSLVSGTNILRFLVLMCFDVYSFLPPLSIMAHWSSSHWILPMAW